MTHKELKTLLESIGLPVAYHHFTKPTKPPYMVFLRDSNDNLSADNSVYHKVLNYQIELYTDKKDIVLEERVETLLKDFYYTTYEVWIESEKLYQIVYELQI